MVELTTTNMPNIFHLFMTCHVPILSPNPAWTSLFCSSFHAIDYINDAASLRTVGPSWYLPLSIVPRGTKSTANYTPLHRTAAKLPKTIGRTYKHMKVQATMKLQMSTGMTNADNSSPKRASLRYQTQLTGCRKDTQPEQEGLVLHV